VNGGAAGVCGLRAGDLAGLLAGFAAAERGRVWLFVVEEVDFALDARPEFEPRDTFDQPGEEGFDCFLAEVVAISRPLSCMKSCVE
jgi:hypothetical protein